MYYLYLFFLIMFLGFFKLPMLGGIIDFLYFVLFVNSIFRYIKIRKTLNPNFVRISEVMIVLFFFYYSYCILSAPMYLSTIKLLNLRAVYPVGFYFMTIAHLNSTERINKCVRVFVIACIAGGIMTILQSLYGNTPMLDPESFYNIGHWEGQMSMIGSISRVMLPVIYSIYILFIAMIFYYVLTKNTNVVGLLIFLLIPIFISFGRTLWGTTVISIILGILLLILNKAIKTTKMIKTAIIIFATVAIGIALLPYIAPDLGESVFNRFSLTFEDVENKSGTLEMRLESSAAALLLWSESIWTGVDPFLMDREDMPELSDVGYTFVLVSIGLMGALIIILIWITQMILSVIMLKKAVLLKNDQMILFSVILFSSVIFWVISQQYLQYNFTLTLTFFIYGLAITVYNIENHSDKLDIESEECSTENATSAS